MAPTDEVVLPFETRVSLVSDRMVDVKSRLAVLAGVRAGEDDRQGERVCTEKLHLLVVLSGFQARLNGDVEGTNQEV